VNINPQEIPTGIDYQLVTVSVRGDQSFSELSKFEGTGWRRVPRSRHPSIRSSNDEWLEQGGLALVERPKYLTDQARKFEQAKADAQILNIVSFSNVEVMRVNGRPLNPNAQKIAAKRRRSFKEFFVFHFWRFRVWASDKFGWRK